MLIQSQKIAELIEPVLHALSRPSAEGIRSILSKARLSNRATREALQERNEAVHLASFELGAGTAFVTMLSTMQQRSLLGDAISTATETPRGIEILHRVAALGESSTPAVQGALADQMGINRGNFNRYVRRLEDDGLVLSRRLGRHVGYSLLPLGLEVLNHERPGWKALDPQTNTLLNFDENTHASPEVAHAEHFGTQGGKIISRFLETVIGCISPLPGIAVPKAGKLAIHNSFGHLSVSVSRIHFDKRAA